MMTGIPTFQEPPAGQKSVGKDVAQRATIVVCRAAEGPSEAREFMLMLGLLEERDQALVPVVPAVIEWTPRDVKGDTNRTAGRK